MEEMEERCGVGELLHHRVRTGPKEQGRMKELKTFNATDQTTVFLKCFQKLLQDQAKVVNSWFECKAYNSVLKQIWKLVLLDCKLLDTEALYKCVPTSYLQLRPEWRACGEHLGSLLAPHQGRGSTEGRGSTARDFIHVSVMQHHVICLICTAAISLCSAIEQKPRSEPCAGANSV